MITDEEKIKWARKYIPYADDDECIEAYDTYMAYRSEGQSHEVSKQYAGLI